MKRLFTLALLTLILASFVLPVMAQEADSTEVLAALPIPAVLLGLMALNNRATEAVKLYLTAKDLPFSPSADVQRFLVLIASMVIGIASAAVTPDALAWLGEGFNPYAGVIVTGLAVSLGGGTVQMILSILQSLRREPVVLTSGTSSTSSTVTFSTPVIEATPPVIEVTAKG